MFETSLRALEARLRACDPGLHLERDAIMAGYTTLHVGGPADLLAHPATVSQLSILLKESHAAGVPVTVIGHGSNLVVRDGGVRGLVIRVCREMDGLEVSGDKIRVMAGTMMSVLAMAAANSDLGGLTFASGIPGTVGGGVYMNAGAYDGEMSQVVTLVEGFEMDGTPFRYTRPEMHFKHRSSRLMEERKVVTQVTFQLPQGKREALLAEMVELNRRRAEKQPLTIPSAGSTFKRPAEGYASQMIDECGLKGYTIGNAQVSEKHAGFLVNRGGTAADFLALIAHVQKVVFEEKGVWLEPEVRIIGEDTGPRAV